MPDIIQRLKDAYIANPASALNMLPELLKQYDDGLIIVLPPEAKCLFLKRPENISHEDICMAFVHQWNAEAEQKLKESEKK